MSGPTDAPLPRTDALLEQVAGLVSAVTGLEPAEVRPDREFVDDLRVDSLAMVEIIEGAGARFGIRIEDEDTRRFVRVGDVVAYLAERTSGPVTPGAQPGPGRQT